MRMGLWSGRGWRVSSRLPESDIFTNRPSPITAWLFGSQRSSGILEWVRGARRRSFREFIVAPLICKFTDRPRRRELFNSICEIKGRLGEAESQGAELMKG